MGRLADEFEKLVGEQQRQYRLAHEHDIQAGRRLDSLLGREPTARAGAVCQTGEGDRGGTRYTLKAVDCSPAVCIPYLRCMGIGPPVNHTVDEEEDQGESVDIIPQASAILRA